jgi:hypothetical protein
MAQGPADDTGRFMNAIAAFSAAPEEVTIYGRLLATRRDQFAPAALGEITETVLRRVVHFSTADGASLAFDVAERRIHRVCQMPAPMERPFSHLMGRDLTLADAQGVLDAFACLTAEADALYAKASLPDAGTTAAFNGLSVSDLKAALRARASEDVHHPNPWPMAGIRSQALAVCLQPTGAQPQYFGDGAYHAALQKLCACPPDAGEAYLWHGALVDEHAVLIAATPDSAIAMLVRGEKMYEVLDQLWAACLQGQ